MYCQETRLPSGKHSLRSLLLNLLMFLPALIITFMWIVFITQHNLVFRNGYTKKSSFENLFADSPGKKIAHGVFSADGHQITVYEFSGIFSFSTGQQCIPRSIARTCTDSPTRQSATSSPSATGALTVQMQFPQSTI